MIKKSHTPKNVALYIRVSSDKQVEEGRSLDSQLEDMKATCKKNNWHIHKVYRDEGLSGRLADRPGLQQMFYDVRMGHVDVIYVYYLNRFYRRLDHLLKAMHFLQTAGISFVSHHENIDFTTPWGKLTLSILGTLAEIYIDNLSETTSRGKKQRASVGLHNGSIPTGYCNGLCYTCTDPNGKDYCPFFGQQPVGDGSVVVPHPIESEAVKLAFKWYSEGIFSDADIAHKLRHHTFHFKEKSFSFRPKRKKGDYKRYNIPLHFTRDTVRDILRRAFYAGFLEYRGGKGVAEERKKFSKPQAVYAGKHLPLISQSQFDLVQSIRKQRGNRPGSINPAARSRRVYLLSRLLYSYPQANKMNAVSNGSSKRFYRDKTNIGRSKLDNIPRSSQPTVAAKPLEDAVLTVLKSLTPPPDYRLHIRAYVHFEEAGMAEINRLRRNIQARFEHLKSLYIDGDMNAAQYEKQKNQLEKESASLLTPSNIDNDTISQWLDDLTTLWAEATPDEMKTILEAVFQRVYVQDNRIVRLVPHPVFFPRLSDPENRLVHPRDDFLEMEK